jgi:hypothetical protein
MLASKNIIMQGTLMFIKRSKIIYFITLLELTSFIMFFLSFLRKGTRNSEITLQMIDTPFFALPSANLLAGSPRDSAYVSPRK